MFAKYKKRKTDDAELDVTAFLNLMIVLVPVLLLTMTFTQLTVLEIKLPELTGGFTVSSDPQSKLEVSLSQKEIKVYYPENTLIKALPKIKDTDSGLLSHDYVQLSLVMRVLKEKLQEKRDAVILAAPDVDYQDLISTMDAVKSYKTVVVASEAEVELFPEISLGDPKR